MRRFHLSMSGMSILLALVLALWEWYFFWFSGKHVAGQDLFGVMHSTSLSAAGFLMLLRAGSA
jgi:hypothetical protein